MKKWGLNDIKDCGEVFSHGNTAVLAGINPWIFRHNGTFVARHKSIRRAYEMVFLPGNTVLMDGRADGAYHYISLDTGEILWSCPTHRKRYWRPIQFAVSPDGRVVYYVYEIDYVIYVDRLIPTEQTCETFKILSGMRVICHCYCDKDGTLSLLQSRHFKETIGEDSVYGYNIESILKWNPGDAEPRCEHQWKKERGMPMAYACNDDYVLFRDYSVRSLKTGETFSILYNNSELKHSPGGIIISGYDAQRKLLTVRYIRSFSTIIIDCNIRKIVAHYAPITHGLTGGCLIGDEFWIGTADGVVKRPFPHIDEFPKKI